MFDSLEDRQYEPTPRRRQEARSEGRVARSHDLSAMLAFVGALLVLWLGTEAVVDVLFDVTRLQLGGAAWLGPDPEPLAGQLLGATLRVAERLGPVLLALLAIAVTVQVAQTGFLVVPQQVAWDVRRISPLTGFNRMLSPESGVRLITSLFKLTTAVSVGATGLWFHRETICGLAAMHAPAAAYQLWMLTLTIVSYVAGSLLLLAILDYGYQRWRHEQSLRMTAQELRDEMKDR